MNNAKQTTDNERDLRQTIALYHGVLKEIGDVVDFPGGTHWIDLPEYVQELSADLHRHRRARRWYLRAWLKEGPIGFAVGLIVGGLAVGLWVW